MNSLIVKIIKAGQVIKREGVFNGTRRVLNAFFLLFQRVGKGDILFIASGVGDSARYRSRHIAEELRLQGFTCGIATQDNPLLQRYVKRFSVFIFQRTNYSKKIAQMIEEIKKQQKEIIFETDDLVFDPQYLKYMHYYQKISRTEQAIYKKGIGREIIQDDYVKVATTTTQFLANKLQAKGKKVFIVPNKLSMKDVKNAQGSREATKRTSTVVRLGYFSGTISHDKDFATITDALMSVMQKYENVELLLVGPLDVESELVQKFSTRIKQLPYVPREKHFANIAKCDINLAPLEYNNPFCEAKSELKFFEAGIVKVPTIAIDNQTYRNAIDDGVDGFVAKDTDEWINKLSQLIENKELRREMGQRAYQKTLQNYTTKNAKNVEYYSYLKNIIR